MMPDAHLVELVEAKALSYDLRPELLRGIVWVESRWDPWAWNPEPRYRYLWDVRHGRPFRSLTPEEVASEYPPDDFHDLRGLSGPDADPEWWGQQASWGLLQVMGAVGRERGFLGPYLSQLCDPYIGLDLGCKHLSHLISVTDHEDAAVAAYNGGLVGNRRLPYRNAGYLAKVREAEERVA